MSYQPYPGGYTPYPSQGFVTPQPSGATAITSAVLAIIGSIGQLLGGVGSLIAITAFKDLREFDDLPGWTTSYFLVAGVVSLVAGVSLLTGAIMLLTRKISGRIWIGLGCVIVLVFGIAGFVAGQAIENSVKSSSNMPAGTDFGFVGLVFLIFPIATLILAWLPATAKYCAAPRP
ncbi:hypothetical protein [Antrihabitans stalactiti]|uniref:Uncharacterized protein n=1 Tax=Antrihabitans stalactiti TaxID=2584121 RepID=A0A848K8S0_9NOCA|nr:hypothetical protein [Antrihabitans stalactiti]NMN93684.1 hypothetical protein [Antrihabitans stalactiti]